MQTDLYQRELRLQEDEIYRLEDYIEEYQGIVRGYRCKVEELEDQLVERRPSERSISAPEAVDPEPLPAPALSEPENRPDPPEPLDMSGMPEIDMPETLSPPVEAPSDFETPPGGDEPPLFNGANATPIEPPAARVALAIDESSSRIKAAQASASIVTDETPPNPYPYAALTEPIRPPTNIDPEIQLQLYEDGGAMVAIVTASDDALLIDFAGEASVMLTDPSIDGSQRRIARWDFTPEEIAIDLSEPMLRLPVLLPTDVPEGRTLRVWIRIVDSMGKKRLQAIDARFNNGRLQSRDFANALPRRLPTVEDRLLRGPDESTAGIVEAVPSDGWRAAGARRVDTAVSPASFDSVW